MGGCFHRGDVERLGAVIEMVAIYHPAGLRILLGERSPLGAAEWWELLDAFKAHPDAERIDKMPNLDGFFYQVAEGVDMLDFIDRVCGWECIVDASKSFRKVHPMDWNLFVEYVRAATDPLSSRLQESPISQAATEYGVDRKTILRRRSLVPIKIARDAVGGFQMALFI